MHRTPFLNFRLLVFPAGSKAFSSPPVFLLFERSFLLSVRLTTDRKAFRFSLQLFSVKTELDSDSDNGNATALWPEEAEATYMGERCPHLVLGNEWLLS